MIASWEAPPLLQSKAVPDQSSNRARRLSVLLALVALVGCAGIPPCPARGGPTWHEVASDNFALATNLRGDDGLDMLASLENLRWSILAATFSGEVDRAGRVNVWLLGEDEWDGMFSRNYRGLFSRSSLLGAAIIVPDDDIFSQAIVKHELAHYVLDAYIKEQPRWFGEGMAQYLETIEYRRAENDAVVTVGAWAPYRTYYRSDLFNPSPTNLLRTSEMLAAPQRRVRENPEREQRFYTTAWLMIQYLVNTHRDGLAAYERDLIAGVDPNLAFARRFPDLSGSKFDVGLYAFANQGAHLVREFHIPPPAYTTQTRVLSEAELHTIRARIDAAADTSSALEPNARLARIAANLDEAEAADPLYLDALALDLAVLGRPASPQTAHRLVAANPDNWLAWYVAAAAFSSSPDLAVAAAHARRKQILLHPSSGK